MLMNTMHDDALHWLQPTTNIAVSARANGLVEVCVGEDHVRGENTPTLMECLQRLAEVSATLLSAEWRSGIDTVGAWDGPTPLGTDPSTLITIGAELAVGLDASPTGTTVLALVLCGVPGWQGCAVESAPRAEVLEQAKGYAYQAVQAKLKDGGNRYLETDVGPLGHPIVVWTKTGGPAGHRPGGGDRKKTGTFMSGLSAATRTFDIVAGWTWFYGAPYYYILRVDPDGSAMEQLVCPEPGYTPDTSEVRRYTMRVGAVEDIAPWLSLDEPAQREAVRPHVENTLLALLKWGSRKRLEGGRKVEEDTARGHRLLAGQLGLDTLDAAIYFRFIRDEDSAPEENAAETVFQFRRLADSTEPDATHWVAEGVAGRQNLGGGAATTIASWNKRLRSQIGRLHLRAQGVPAGKKTLKDLRGITPYCRPAIDALPLPFSFAAELPDKYDTPNGVAQRVVVNRYERDPKARQACIDAHGTTCRVCGFDFESHYGELGRGFIHVHHIVPISEVGSDEDVDPVRDLVPVCPNCHAMLHRPTDGVLSVDSLRRLLTARGYTVASTGDGR